MESTDADSKVLYSRRLKRFFERHISIASIVVFEFMGTGFFAYGVMVCLNTSIFKQQLAGVFSSIFISLSLFLAIALAGSFTGGHMNPAVTLAFMLKKQGRVPWKKGFIYMASQITGAWMGALVAWIIAEINDAPLIGQMPWHYVIYAFLSEIVGSFIFVLFIMIATTSDTTFCQGPMQVYIFIPMILLIAREYSYRSQGLNPAFAIAFEFFYAAYNDTWYLWKYVWATFFGPFVGSALAVLFFEFFYRRFVIIYKKRKLDQAQYHKLQEVAN